MLTLPSACYNERDSFMAAFFWQCIKLFNFTGQTCSFSLTLLIFFFSNEFKRCSKLWNTKSSQYEITFLGIGAFIHIACPLFEICFILQRFPSRKDSFRLLPFYTFGNVSECPCYSGISEPIKHRHLERAMPSGVMF